MKKLKTKIKRGFNKRQFYKDLEAMSVLELKKLISVLEEHFDVKAPKNKNHEQK